MTIDIIIGPDRERKKDFFRQNLEHKKPRFPEEFDFRTFKKFGETMNTTQDKILHHTKSMAIFAVKSIIYAGFCD